MRHAWKLILFWLAFRLGDPMESLWNKLKGKP